MQPAHSAGRNIAFVTGASVGIGYATALALARDGYDVAVSARSAARLERVVTELHSLGARSVCVALDLHSLDSIERATAAVIEALGPIDVLVNNAGTTQRRAALDVTSGEWDDVIDANLKGTFFLTQQVARHLINAGKPGCVINMASTHGLLGFPERIVYGISKAAIMHMTRMLAIEWAPYHVNVNAIGPSVILTELTRKTIPLERQKVLMASVPLGRFGEIEDVMGACVYLASPESDFVTGQILYIDGGLTAKG